MFKSFNTSRLIVTNFLLIASIGCAFSQAPVTQPWSLVPNTSNYIIKGYHDGTAPTNESSIVVGGVKNGVTNDVIITASGGRDVKLAGNNIYLNGNNTNFYGSATVNGKLTASSIGIGTSTIYTKLDVAGNNMYIAGHIGTPQYIANWKTSGVWGIGAIDDDRNTIRIGAVNHPAMTWNPSISVRLDVAGSIRANEIVVNTDGADFVFAPNYKLRPLAEVEQYVTEHKHLPEIAAAAEMQQNGLNISEMQTKLLQKVEELTLYVIELQKQNEAQTKEINELKDKNNK